MKKFRVKLTLIFILIIALTVLGLGLFAANNLKATHIHALQESMLRESKLVMAMTDWMEEGTLEQRRAFFVQQATSLKSSAGVRVTFIDLDGTVLGDSDENPALMDNHLQREELQQARGAGADNSGFALRFSDTLDRDMLNTALLIHKDERQVGYLRLSMGLEVVEESTRKLWSYYFAGLTLLFILSALISYRVAKNLTKPLEEITKVAHQISNANYQSRVYLSNKDEIGALGEAINIMAHSLQSQMKRITESETRIKTVLENMISGVIMIDNEGRIVLMNKTAEEILGMTSIELIGRTYHTVKARQLEFTTIVEECMERNQRVREEVVFYYPEERIIELSMAPLMGPSEEWSGAVIVLHNITAIRRLEKMRSEFVANVSHELKTPIAAVKGFAETLLAGAIHDKETAEAFVKIIYDESERLNRLIMDILELSKIESKQIPLQFSPVELNEFVHRIIKMLGTEAAKKRIHLTMDVAEDMFIEADEDRLRQVLINVVSNGIHYTSEGGSVSVTITSPEMTSSTDEERVWIRITDTGMGIPKRDIPRIFERFYRVDKARTRRSGGTGLGLSIVKHIVDLHHGEIRVESELGQGTTFTIDLPVIQEIRGS